MVKWGTCSTIKAPVDEVVAFIAHHQSLGADEIWIFFDDPDDPALPIVKNAKGVVAVACDDAYWNGNRPEVHENRQAQNARHAYRSTHLDWIAHIDGDELIHLDDGTVADRLAEIDKDALIVRMKPWEAMCSPYRDGPFNAHLFRAPIRRKNLPVLHSAMFGEFEILLEDGILSHANGKSFYRTGIAGISPRIHTAALNGERLKGNPFHPDLALLHFHAHDREAWFNALPYRIEKGAYKCTPILAEFFADSPPEDIEYFYDTVMVSNEKMLLFCERKGQLKDIELDFPTLVYND